VSSVRAALMNSASSAPIGLVGRCSVVSTMSPTVAGRFPHVDDRARPRPTQLALQNRYPQTRLRQSGNRHRTAEAAARIHREIRRSTDSEGQAEVIVIDGLWSCV
jgi:hypothetical protein